MFTRFIVLAATAGLAVSAGCKSKSEDTTAKVQMPEKEVYLIGFSQCTVEEPWRVQMNKDVEAAAAGQPNLKLIMSNAEDQVDKQVNDVENFIAQGVDAIIISPKETATSLTNAIAKAYNKRIPVLILDRRIPGDQYTAFIGADNFKMGKAAGNFIKKALDGKGNIVELKGNASTVPAQLRHNGFREAIKSELDSGAIKIVHEADIDWKENKARDEMESALAANPDIDLVYGHNDPAAHGAYDAAKNAGRADEIMFVGIDALSHEGMAYVKEGILDASVDYPTGGKEAIEAILDLIAGREIPFNIQLDNKIYTQDNVNNGGAPIE